MRLQVEKEKKRVSLGMKASLLGAVAAAQQQADSARASAGMPLGEQQEDEEEAEEAEEKCENEYDSDQSDEESDGKEAPSDQEELSTILKDITQTGKPGMVLAEDPQDDAAGNHTRTHLVYKYSQAYS